MENSKMNKTVKYITMATIGLTFMFGNTGELTNVPNKVYPNKKPLISKTPTAVSVNASSDARHLKVSDVKHLKKVRNHNANSWPASHIHNGCHTEKVKTLSSVDRPKRLRRSINKKGR